MEARAWAKAGLGQREEEQQVEWQVEELRQRQAEGQVEELGQRQG